MNDFAIIPALDLKGGAVVHARGGARAEYRPIETPAWRRRRSDRARPRPPRRHRLGRALYRRPRRYRGRRQSFRRLPRSLRAPFRAASCWIDAGFTNVTDCAFWLPLGATLVIGTESLSFAEDWRELRASFGESLVLSLDYGAEGQRGPSTLFAEPAHWPERIIAMSLDRVGTGTGPDVERLRGRGGASRVSLGLCVRRHAQYRRPRGRRRGRCRRGADCHGAASRRRQPKEIAAFERRRRSRSD